MTIKAKTICVKCRYHRNTHHGDKHVGPPPDAWHFQICTHPEVQAVAEQDPVTGKTMYAHENDLEAIVMVDSPFPYCRDINHGNCPYFLAKPLQTIMEKVYNYASR